MPSSLVVKGAPAAEHCNSFFNVIELGGLQELLIQDAVIGLNETILLGCGHMRELLGYCFFLQIVPHRMGDKL